MNRGRDIPQGFSGEPRSVLIRPCRPEDAGRICEIYNHYVRESVATFEETPVEPVEMERRIAEVTADYPWLVREEDDAIAGYAYATRWKTRSAYRYAAESTIYLAPAACGRGLGVELYRTLIGILRDHDLHCVLGGISLPNPASVVLHEILGFRKVGELREIGWKLGRWVDVGYWQLVF
ncbi:GNAT family N-acetyltransferase [soil metagenome]